MSLPIEDLTPRQIVAELDKYIVGQDAAKRAVAVALRNRWRRQQLPPEERREIVPKNILMIGPTGVGKTEIARRLARLAKAPFVKIEATKFTEVGYVGRDVESMIRDLTAAAVRLIETEKADQVRPEAREEAIDEVTDLLLDKIEASAPPQEISEDPNPLTERAAVVFGGDPDGGTRKEAWKKLRKEIVEGQHDRDKVTIEFEEPQSPFMQVFTPHGMEEMGFDPFSNLGGGSRTSSKEQTVAEAIETLTDVKARGRIDSASLHRDAVERVEQSGMVFLDEIDKIAIKGQGSGPDVSREGVQRDLLPIIEGSTVATKYGQVKTDHILFIAAGAFHVSKPSDLIPELQGRLPIRVELTDLTKEDFVRILREPQNAITKQYQDLLRVEGVKMTFTSEALTALADYAFEVNAATENIGARRLQTLMERLLEDLMFDAPEDAPESIEITAEIVRERLDGVAGDEDLSRFIL